jgi:hypothetical protein
LAAGSLSVLAGLTAASCGLQLPFHLPATRPMTPLKDKETNIEKDFICHLTIINKDYKEEKIN